MKILLIFPPKETIALVETQFHKHIDEESGDYPALGLMYIATYIKKNSPHTVKIIDAPTLRLGHDDVQKKIAEEKPDIVGVYFNTEYLIDSLKIAAAAKKADPNVKVVAGGPHVIVYPKLTIEKPDVDYCVYGEGEIAFKKLADALAGSGDAESIEGVITKKNKDGAHKLQKIEDLDSLPFPDRALLNVKEYGSFITYATPVTTMMTSRGCAFNCYYCNNIERAQKVRMRSADNVVAEMEEIAKLGVKDIIFFDENFTFDIKRVDEICDRLIGKKLGVRWHCRSRADMKLDAPILAKMKKAGCRMVQFGIETGVQRLQGVINKKLDLQKVKETVKMVKKAGILVYGNFMLGHPSETREEMLKTVDFALELGLDYAPFSNFHPLPESVFYLNALKNGAIKEDYWRKFAADPSRQIERYWWPEQDIGALREMNKHAFRRFYLRPSYILKSLLRPQSFRQKLWQVRSGLKLLVFGG
ncbi:MAG: radical SAM protein [Endomicrobiales bacterium]|nr:radical SAM protein [Endomicrobiales bacterium]